MDGHSPEERCNRNKGVHSSDDIHRDFSGFRELKRFVDDIVDVDPSAYGDKSATSKS